MIADAIIANDNRNIWREAKTNHPKRKTIPNTIDGVTEDRKSQNGLYNSVPYDVNAMNRIKQCVQQRLHNNIDGCVEVTTDDIQNVISQLKIGKYDGDQGLELDHLIYSTILLHRVLSVFIAECTSVSTIGSISKDARR